MAGEAETAASTAAPVEGAAATSLTGEGGAPAAASPEAGQGGDSVAGQGADKGQVAEGDASAKDDAQTGGEGGETAQGAPEQYADFALPDGYTLEGDMLETVTAFAKAHNLTQEGAQALVDLGAKQAQAIAAQFATEAQENPVPLAQHWAETWSKQTQDDPELGGKNLKDTMVGATKAFATFGSPALGELLNKTGLAHNVEMIRFMRNVSKAVSEDTLVAPSGGQGQGGKRPFYNNTPGMK